MVSTRYVFSVAVINCSITDTQTSDGILDFTFDPDPLLNGAIIYTCIDGYTLIGDAMRTCQLNGTWNGTTPTCDRKSSK